MSILTKETIAAGLRKAARIAAGYVPCDAELANAPLLSHWAIGPQGSGLMRLVGIVAGHPSIRDGWCTTSIVLAANEEASWARTVSRYYRLGPRLGEVRQ
ncbi:DUF6634 family protein [Devosia sp. A369]